MSVRISSTRDAGSARGCFTSRTASIACSRGERCVIFSTRISDAAAQPTRSATLRCRIGRRCCKGGVDG
ncbi:MAG TPA: hypothetical protein VF541_13555 [Longimicrobium sp.]